MQTATLTLADFLLARITEDEAAVREATPGPWGWVWYDGPNALVQVVGGEMGAPVLSALQMEGLPPFIDVTSADAHHIERHDPARVLAECEAKRGIIYDHRQHPLQVEGFCATCGMTNGPCRTIRLLALPYAEHPDFREEWRP